MKYEVRSEKLEVLNIQATVGEVLQASGKKLIKKP